MQPASPETWKQSVLGRLMTRECTQLYPIIINILFPPIETKNVNCIFIVIGEFHGYRLWGQKVPVPALILSSASGNIITWLTAGHDPDNNPDNPAVISD